MPGVAALLLAAGESSRMGEPKALLPWLGGRALLAWGVESLREAGYSPIVVVLGHAAERLRAEVPSHPGVSIVVNDGHAGGRSTSIVAGVRAVPADADAVLVASIDQPRSVTLLRDLRVAWEASRPLIAVPALDGRPGHPPLFSAVLRDELLNVSEASEGLRAVVSRHRAERLLVPSDDPLALANLNTRADYEAALRLASGGV
ncbi:MAG: nucleotidyltransferase family protein [SAR202 cluster bacterium]|nr:nucleotidyltransferase family protein [SAR202 cluster bacterium]